MCLSSTRPIRMCLSLQKTSQNVCFSSRRPIRMCVCHAEDQLECVFVTQKTNRKCVCQAEDQLECVFVTQKTSQNVWSSSRRLTRIALQWQMTTTMKRGSVRGWRQECGFLMLQLEGVATVLQLCPLPVSETDF